VIIVPSWDGRKPFPVVAPPPAGRSPRRVPRPTDPDYPRRKRVADEYAAWLHARSPSLFVSFTYDRAAHLITPAQLQANVRFCVMRTNEVILGARWHKPSRRDRQFRPLCAIEQVGINGHAHGADRHGFDPVPSLFVLHHVMNNEWKERTDGNGNVVVKAYCNEKGAKYIFKGVAHPSYEELIFFSQTTFSI
jgi:hypothetical protein